MALQVVDEGGQYRVNGPGELLTTVLPLLDLVTTSRGAGDDPRSDGGVPRAAPSPSRPPGGTGKTSTMAKLMRRPGFSFMGDDWGFVTARRTAAQLREAHVHQAAPPADLPAPVQGLPQAAGPGQAVEAPGSRHDRRAPAHREVPQAGRRVPADVARAPDRDRSSGAPRGHRHPGRPAADVGLRRAVRGRPDARRRT